MMTPVRLLVVLLLTLMALMTGGQTPAGAAAQAPTATGSACDGAEEWLNQTWEINLRATEAIQRFVIEVQEGEPFKPEVFNSVAEDLTTVVKIQSASTPPPPAKDFNEILIERWTLQAEAMALFAQQAATGDQEFGEQAVDRTGRARRLGERAVSVVQAFKVECGLADSAAFRPSACHGQLATVWANFTSVRFTKLLNLSDTAADRVEVGLSIDEQIVEMENLRDEQVRSAVPEGAEEYQLVLLEYYEATIAGFRAWAAGDQAELDRLVEEVLRLEQELVEEETEFTAPCITGGH